MESQKDRIHIILLYLNHIIIKNCGNNLTKIWNLYKFLHEVSKYNYTEFINLPSNKIKKYTRFLLKAYDPNEINNENQNEPKYYQCINCYEILHTHQGLARHYQKNRDCALLKI